MGLPNRYHPYNRKNNNANNNNQAHSPRYPAAPSIPQALHPMPTISEQPSMQPYQYIPPGYIKGVTQDGKALAVKSAYQTADGRLHVEMEVVRFPSEDVKFYSGARITTIPSPPPPAIPSPPMMQHIDPALSGFGVRRGQMARMGSGSEASSQDGRSVRATSEECAISTDGEDAEGDADEISEGQWRAIMQQKRIIRDFATQRAAMRHGQ